MFIAQSQIFLDYFNDMKTSNGYRKCKFEDLDSFNDCKPVNCELKYFGKRNFFDASSCVSVKKCEQDDDSIYDYETNECQSSRNILSSKDREEMKNGKFTNWIEANDLRDGGKNPYEKTKILKRLRRELNKPTTGNDAIKSAIIFVLRLVSSCVP